MFLFSVHLEKLILPDSLTLSPRENEWQISYDLLGSKYIKTAYSQKLKENVFSLGGARKQLWLEGSPKDI